MDNKQIAENIIKKAIKPPEIPGKFLVLDINHMAKLMLEIYKALEDKDNFYIENKKNKRFMTLGEIFREILGRIHGC